MSSPATREVVAAAVLAAALAAVTVMAVESRNNAAIVHDVTALVRDNPAPAPTASKPDCLMDHDGDRCEPAIDIDHPDPNDPHLI